MSLVARLLLLRPYFSLRSVAFRRQPCTLSIRSTSHHRQSPSRHYHHAPLRWTTFRPIVMAAQTQTTEQALKGPAADNTNGDGVPAAKKQKTATDAGAPHATGQQQEQEKKKKKKKKVLTPAVQLRGRIHQAAKRVDLHADAFAAYEEAKRDGIKLSSDCLVTLLFLAAGGDQWETYVYSEEKRAEYLETGRLDKCDEILASLRESSSSTSETPMVEMCYTALARKEAIMGNGEAALQQALSLPDPLQRRNRCFLPALAAFGKRGDATRSLKVYENLMQSGLEPGETEFAKILEAISKSESEDSAVSWERVESVLRHMSRETSDLEASTIDVLRDVFGSRTAREAAAAGTSGTSGTSTSTTWSTGMCTVRADGYCERCDDTLQAIDLDDGEYAEFARGISSLAEKQGKRPDDFHGFVKWLDEHGPFGVIIDAANVAFYNQNFESGGFNFSQIEAVVDRVSADYPDLKPLVVLHVNRTRGPAASAPKARALLQTLTEQNRFFAAPMGSNDDWYWMYAAVVAGTEGILVSNDEMRDHLFNLLAPKYFKKWKQRHQMRYTFSGDPNSLAFENPSPFTRCTQVLCKADGSVSWMFPVAGAEGEGEGKDDWLCCSTSGKR